MAVGFGALGLGMSDLVAVVALHHLRIVPKTTLSALTKRAAFAVNAFGHDIAVFVIWLVVVAVDHDMPMLSILLLSVFDDETIDGVVAQRCRCPSRLWP